MTILKDVKLKAFVRNKSRETLLRHGRKLVEEQGAGALSARKLALRTNSSVGMIYSLFATMDQLAAEINVATLTELYQQMSRVVLATNPFNNLNRYADVFAAYVEANPNLWHLLFNRHLALDAPKSTIAEARIIKKIDILIGMQAARLIGGLNGREKRLSIKVLEMSLFALSGYLLGNKLNRKSGLNRGNLCKLLMNTYIAGMASLKRVK